MRRLLCNLPLSPTIRVSIMIFNTLVFMRIKSHGIFLLCRCLESQRRKGGSQETIICRGMSAIIEWDYVELFQCSFFQKLTIGKKSPAKKSGFKRVGQLPGQVSCVPFLSLFLFHHHLVSYRRVLLERNQTKLQNL